MIADSLATLKAEGREAFFDLEHFFDGYKDDPAYAVARPAQPRTRPAPTAWSSATPTGARFPRRWPGSWASCPVAELGPIGVHFHDDTGNAVANALAALERGAVARAGHDQRLGGTLREPEPLHPDPHPLPEDGRQAPASART